MKTIWQKKWHDILVDSLFEYRWLIRICGLRALWLFYASQVRPIWLNCEWAGFRDFAFLVAVEISRLRLLASLSRFRLDCTTAADKDFVGSLSSAHRVLHSKYSDNNTIEALRLERSYPVPHNIHLFLFLNVFALACLERKDLIHFRFTENFNGIHFWRSSAV